jgi:hypothetical protein
MIRIPVYEWVVVVVRGDGVGGEEGEGRRIYDAMSQTGKTQRGTRYTELVRSMAKGCSLCQTARRRL